MDSPDHRSHMAYPTRYNSGDCPSTHPIRLPGIFYEAIYSIDQYPHGQGTQPFVLSNGDPTGYGFHGDFVSIGSRALKKWPIMIRKYLWQNGLSNGLRLFLCVRIFLFASISNSRCE